MKDYKRWNTLLGWIVFLITSFVYLSTVEPTSSFWDCGEFIATAYKLEVGHPPGAPFFMILGRLFSAFVDASNAALAINILSALSSSFTILFLFWTITAFGRKLATRDGMEMPEGSTLAVLGSGLVGALAYAFTDSFWFSAVEGEVYAISSLFTALVFWAIMKWDAEPDNPRQDRWIILIAYLMGLSIGVHLLNLLCIPAIALVVYFRRNEYSHKGLIITGAVALAILGFIQSGIIAGVVKLAGGYELFFTNTLSTGFNVGATFFAVLLVALVIMSIMYAHRPSSTMRYGILAVLVLMFIPLVGSDFLSAGTKVLVTLMGGGLAYLLFRIDEPSPMFQLSMVSFGVILLGYSTFAMIVIRSSANPPMDENNPENVFALLSYLNREQYGDRPLLRGHYWMAPTVGSEDGNPVYMPGHSVKKGAKTLKTFNNPYDAEVFAQMQQGDTQVVEEYIISDKKENTVYTYDDEFIALFPRMYSSQPNHVEAYKVWSNFKGKKTRATDQAGNRLLKPTSGENLRFFTNYQVSWMYWRYFMWNFSGRQNDKQGHGSILDGNYVTGLDFIDEERLGSQQNLPEYQQENRAFNKFFMIPFILGLIGLFYQAFRDVKNWLVVMLLFLLTGLAIVVYLNQYPFQPRERDYAYVGSFYAFAIWIGLGVYAMFDACRTVQKETLLKVAGAVLGAGGLIFLISTEKSFAYSILYMGVTGIGAMAVMSLIGSKAGGKATAIIATVIGLSAPYLLVADGWDDHDRSHRETALDFARNYLNSCTKNAMIFTNGDNDTFPLWYVQEVEGIRTDVRVINLSLLNTDWYTDQMKRQAYESEPVPFSLTEDKYRQGTRDVILLNPKNSDKRVDLGQAIDFVANDKNTLQLQGGMRIPYFPSNKFSIPLDKQDLLAKGVITAEDTAKVADRMTWNMNGNYITKNNLMVLDLLAHHDWTRDIYWAVTTGQDAYLNLSPYFELTGMAYRLTPIRHEKSPNPNRLGGVDADVMYDNVMTQFEWGNMDSHELYLDENNLRLITNIRLQMANLVDELITQGDNEKAHDIIDLTFEKMPEKNVPLTRVVLPLVEGYARVGDDEAAIAYSKRLFDLNEEELMYYSALDARFLAGLDEEMRINLYVAQRIQYVAQQYELEELSEYIDGRLESMRQSYDMAQSLMDARRKGADVAF